MYQILTIVALTVLYVAGRRWWKERRLRVASEWPIVSGYVAQIEETRDDHGFLIVTLAYTYEVQGERYVGRESFTFIRDDEAARFEAGCRERTVLVHYRSDKPAVSMLPRMRAPA